jgi:hypothetical protein
MCCHAACILVRRVVDQNLLIEWAVGDELLGNDGKQAPLGTFSVSHHLAGEILSRSRRRPGAFGPAHDQSAGPPSSSTTTAWRPERAGRLTTLIIRTSME